MKKWKKLASAAMAGVMWVYYDVRRIAHRLWRRKETS